MEATAISTFDRPYYCNYYGHKPDHLERVLAHLHRTKRALVFLVGDSTLDKEHWLLKEPTVAAAPAYRGLLTQSVPDVCHQMNMLLPDDLVCVNAALEERTAAGFVPVHCGTTYGCSAISSRKTMS
jgi:hypothetical protein